MSSTLLIFMAIFLISLFSIVTITTKLANKYVQTQTLSLVYHPFIYIFAVYAIGSVVAFWHNDNLDFIAHLTAIRAFLPLLLTLLIFFVALSGSKVFYYLTVIGSVTTLVYLQPLGIGFPFQGIPSWAAKLLLIAIFSVFCLYFKILNCLPHTILIPSITIMLGFILLGVLSGIPVYIMLCATALCGVLCAFLSVNFYQVKLELDSPSCTALAFLIANLCLLTASEASFTSSIIFTIIFWVELISAIYNRFFVNHSGSLLESTNFYDAAQKRTLYNLTLNIFKLSATCIFIGWFQLFAVNQYSLFIVAFLITYWLSGILADDNSHPTKLKDINKEFVSDIKKNISDVKNSFSNLNNKEKDK